MKNFLTKAAALGLSAGMVLGSAGMPVFAASTDLIDTTAKGSLTITKYDQTAYEFATGNSVDDLNLADGETDAEVEAAMEGYELNGVQFGLFKVGDVKTYTNAGSIVVCYSIPDDLITVLGLDTANAVTTDGGAYYFTSDQINDAMEALLSGDMDGDGESDDADGDGEADNNTDGKILLEQWWASQSIQNDANYKETGADGVDGEATFENLEVGLYLVVETDVPENVYSTTDPFFVSIPMTDATGSYWFYDVHVYPKNQSNNPSIDKLVVDHDDLEDETSTFADATDASEGDIVDYRIVLHFPMITSEATYLTEWETTDTQSAGSSYIQDSFQVFIYDNESDAKYDADGSNAIATWTLGDEVKIEFSSFVNANNNVQETATITVTEDGLKEINGSVTATALDGVTTYVSEYAKYSECYMVIAYSSTVHSDMTVVLGDANSAASGTYVSTGNENTAEIEYSRSGGDPSYSSSFQSNKLKDVAKVFTYGLSGIFETGETVDDADPLKTFQNTSGTEEDEDATEVVFVLYNATKGTTAAEGGYYVPVTANSVDADGVTTDGIYFVVDDTDGETTNADSQYHVDLVDATNNDVEKVLASIYDSIKITPDKDGYLRVDGLEAGTYILTEVETVDGYALLKDSITIVIDSTDVDITPEAAGVTGMDGGVNAELVYKQTDTADATVDGNVVTMGIGATDSENGYVMIAIENTQNFELPKTGGLGTILFTMAGAAVVIMGVALVTRDKKKAEA